MEDALVQEQKLLKQQRTSVLILVVMEDALVPEKTEIKLSEIES